MRRFRITEPINLLGDRHVNDRTIGRREHGGQGNLPEKRDESDDSENDTSDDETNPSTRRDFNLTVIQEIGSCIDS